MRFIVKILASPHLLRCTIITLLFFYSIQLQGQTFDGRNHRVGKPCIASGDNILTIDYIHVWDNGEGKAPWGGGSDVGWWGPFPKKHGPFGNLHVLVYSPYGELLNHINNLPGPEWTGKKYEWLDNQWMSYYNFGIYDWDWHSYGEVDVLIYESDPSDWKGIKVPQWLSGREHDVLIQLRVPHNPGVPFLYASDPIADIGLITKNVPDYGAKIKSVPSVVHILNETKGIAIPIDIFNGQLWERRILRPYEYTRIFLFAGQEGILRMSCWPTTCDYTLRPGRKYRINRGVYEE